MRNQYARNNNNLVILSDVASACGAGRSEQRRARGQKLFALQAKTTFGHRKSDKHERIRNPLLKEKRIAAVALLPRNDKATAYCTHLAAFVTTKRFVILRAKHERIRNPLLKEKRIAARLSVLAMTGKRKYTRAP